MSAKSKHRKALIEQRISECKKHYQRAELVGGCVLLKSEYWTARAERAAQQKLNETLIQEDIRGEWFAMLSHMANQAGFKPAWASHQFKTKFGEFPPWDWQSNIVPQPPNDEVRAFVRASRAEYLKSKKTKKASDQVETA
jgi:hypothetical protein